MRSSKSKLPKLEAQFVKSAVSPRDYPVDLRPEVALVGRSNAGKSSFLNALVGKQVAFVSQQPGKTRLINFFDMGKHYRLVDLPGYGYSKRSGEEQRSWQQMIESYFSTRGQLAGMLLLMDCRRDWSEDERAMVNFTNRLGRPSYVLLTKADKLKESEVKKRIAAIQKSAHMKNVFACSAVNADGVFEIENRMFENWIKNVEPK